MKHLKWLGLLLLVACSTSTARSQGSGGATPEKEKAAIKRFEFEGIQVGTTTADAFKKQFPDFKKREGGFYVQQPNGGKSIDRLLVDCPDNIVTGLSLVYNSRSLFEKGAENIVYKLEDAFGKPTRRVDRKSMLIWDFPTKKRKAVLQVNKTARGKRSLVLTISTGEGAAKSPAVP
ncbi:MAG: hypothetical protein AAF514_06220 [Verrucomicrobiota bacterium]